MRSECGPNNSPVYADTRLGPPSGEVYPVFTEAPEKTYSLAAIVKGKTPIVGRGPEQTIPSMPHLLFGEAAVFMLTIVLSVILAILLDAPLKEVANPKAQSSA